LRWKQRKARTQPLLHALTHHFRNLSSLLLSSPSIPRN